MTAILNFTLPKLEVAPGKAAAPDVSSSARHTGELSGTSQENQTESGAKIHKDFAQLLDERIVKKETAKGEDFDTTAQAAGDDGDDVENPSGATLVNNSSQAPAIRPAVLGHEPGSKPVIGPSTAESTEISSSAKDPARLTGSAPGTDAKVAGEALERPAPRTAAAISLDLQPAPAVNKDTRPAAVESTATRTAEPPVATTLLKGNSSAPALTAKEIPSAAESEKQWSEQARQSQSVAAEAITRSARTATAQQTGVGVQNNLAETEMAAISGNRLPLSGNLLPPEQGQSGASALQAAGFRANDLALASGNDRPTARFRSTIGKNSGELDGLEKVTVANTRITTAEVLGKTVSQVHPLTATESSPGFQNAGTEPAATGLLAQHQAGVERSTSTRMSGPLAVFDGANTSTLQAGGQDMSAQLGSRIRWMNNINLSSAELKLSPAELGTLEIRITAEDDQARVNFITSTSAAKELIEASMPRLRELLGQSGLLLEQGDVTHRDMSHNSSKENVPSFERSAVESLESASLENTMPMYQRSASDHKLDHFA